DKLAKISKRISSSAAATKLCHKLAEVIKHGSAFHHAGLKPAQRSLIEDSFRENLIKAISCTPTLAAGVNLPARRAIIRDCKRFESGLGAAYIPTSEYKQCAGRAGRPQYDEYGEAVLIAKTSSQASTLFEKYIHADPEPITSKLSNESALRIHILASIAGGYVHDVDGMFEFISHTFLAHQQPKTDLFDFIVNIFDFLQQEGFVEKSGYRFFATPLGALTSRLYIDPVTTITIREGLNRISKDFSPIGVLHMITCCPDGPGLSVGKKDVEDLEFFASHHHEDFIFTPENYPEIEDFYTYLSSIKAAWLLNQWIEEEKEDVICDQFGIGPGDVYRHIDATQWLLYAAGTIAELLRKKSLTFELQDLRNRVRYGVKKELLDVVQLKGVGRIRARVLFQKGYTKLGDFKFTSENDLGAIRQIGKTLAKDIIQQVKNFSLTQKQRSQNETAVAAGSTDEWED
ncbi:MAG: ATP-dependent DNA helicase, partial [Candidatus Omnitrophica bacterium]|nr:ATP-dependent DNA helicase [Candidatus Omnitrophota bacterium]